MIGIIITVAIFSLILLILLLPIRVFLAFGEDFAFTVKLSFFRVFSSDKPSKQSINDHKNKPSEKKKVNNENTIKRLFREKGVTEATKELFAFAQKVLKTLRKLLKHMTFHHLCFNLTVATDDAAKTAVTYGEICAAAYPFFAFLDQASNVKYKDISIETDFAATEIRAEAFAVITTRTVFLLVAALKILLALLSFRKQVQNNG